MDADKFVNKPVKTESAHNIQLNIRHLDPSYRVEISPVSPATKTGLIALFKVVPNTLTLPGFIARWDDRQQTIDVDPDPLDCIERDDWRNECHGYSGHHSDCVSKNPRVYQIDLEIPARQVLHASGTLNLNIGARVGDAIEMADSVGISCEGVVVAKKISGWAT